EKEFLSAFTLEGQERRVAVFDFAGPFTEKTGEGGVIGAMRKIFLGVAEIKGGGLGVGWEKISPKSRRREMVGDEKTWVGLRRKKVKPIKTWGFLGIKYEAKKLMSSGW
ncbi:8078_t:CDS:2, partial [Racocetra persica]